MGRGQRGQGPYGTCWYQKFVEVLYPRCIVQVVGETEKENRTVNVRTRDNARHGEHKLAAMIEVLRKERDERSLESCFGHKAAQPAAAAAAAPSNGAAANGSAQPLTA